MQGIPNNTGLTGVGSFFGSLKFAPIPIPKHDLNSQHSNPYPYKMSVTAYVHISTLKLTKDVSYGSTTLLRATILE